MRDVQDLAHLIAGNPWMMACLKAVAALGLPEAWIGAGFLRAPVWDRLHGYDQPTPLGDIDVITFDPATEAAADAAHEAWLDSAMAGLPWSVHNQAHMHLKNGDAPYRGIADALRHWLETPTAIAARLDGDGKPELVAPFGFDDLFDLVIRPTPHARQHRMTAYRARIAKKGWQATWPKVRVLES